MAIQSMWRGTERGSQQYMDVGRGGGLSRYRDRESWQQDREQNSGQGLARALGWFSIGLGLAQIAEPRRLAQMIGVPDDTETLTVLRAVGIREIATGIGILAQPGNAGWLWARAAGDVMDLALLGAALASDDTEKDKVMMATLAVAGVTVLDLLGSEQLSSGDGGGMMASLRHMPMRRMEQHDGRWQQERGSRQQEHGSRRQKEQRVHVKRAITINRQPEELYAFWRDFQNLPRVMSHLESVQVTGDRQSHWVAKAPAGMKVEWDAEIMEDQPNEMIAWRSLEGAEIPNSGLVRFTRAPGGRGTEIQVELQYNPPGGAIGAKIAKLFGEEPEQQIREDLRRFKQMMETGETVESEASIQGRSLLQRPAQPPKGEIND